MQVKQAVILAGGQGTRLRPLTDTVPKPMIRFHGVPFVEYLIRMLKEQGIEEVVLLIGYLGHVVRDYFKDGRDFGVRILYSEQPVAAETGTRLREAIPLLQNYFLFLYCDNYWPLDLRKLTMFYESLGVEGMFTVYRNDDGYTKNNVKVSSEGIVEIYDKSRQSEGLQGVDIGFGIFQKKTMEALPDGNISFESATYSRLVAKRELGAFVTSHRYYSVGSHERLGLTETFLKREPAILLDRDGTLNQKAARGEYIISPENFIWLPGALQALKYLKESGFRIFLISNQAGIARGQLTQEGLDRIHEKMKSEAELYGGGIDGVYVCPHHWDDDCSCRKPKPGLLFQVQREHHLDLSRIWFLGDDERDVEAGVQAGCKTGLVTEEKTLLSWVEKILKNRE